MAVSASQGLYSDKMKGLFGMRSTMAAQEAQKAAKATEEYEVDQIATNKMLLRRTEEQIELLKDIKDNIAKAGGGGLGIADLIGLKMGEKALGRGAGIFKKLFAKAGDIRGNLLKGATEGASKWSRNVSGSIKGVFTGTSNLVSKSSTRITTRAATYVTRMANSILSSLRATTAMIGSIFAKGFSGLAAGSKGAVSFLKGAATMGLKVISKLATPVVAAYGAYDGIKQAKENPNYNKLKMDDKIAVAIGGAVDTLTFGIPDYISRKINDKGFVENIMEGSLKMQKEKAKRDPNNVNKSIFGHANEFYNWITGSPETKPTSSGPQKRFDNGKNRRGTQGTSLREITDTLDLSLNGEAYRAAAEAEVYGKKAKDLGSSKDILNTIIDRVEAGPQGGQFNYSMNPNTISNLSNKLNDLQHNGPSISELPLGADGKSKQFGFMDYLRKINDAIVRNTNIIAFETAKTTKAVEEGNREDRKQNRKEDARNNAGGAIEDGVPLTGNPRDTMADPRFNLDGRVDSKGNPIVSEDSSRPSIAPNMIGKDAGIMVPSPYQGNIPKPAGPANTFTGADLGKYKALTTKARAASAKNDNLPKSMQTINDMIAAGASPKLAYAIAGNMHTESKFDNTNNTGDGGKAYGLMQWHPDRQAKLKAFAKANGYDYTTRETQARFAVEETIAGSPYADYGSVAARKAIEGDPNMNVADASSIFMKKAERPKPGPTAHENQRRAAAGEFAKQHSVLPTVGAELSGANFAGSLPNQIGSPGKNFKSPVGTAAVQGGGMDIKPIAGLNISGGKMDEVKGLIAHHTGGRGTPAGVINTLNQRGLGVQYIMDREGNVVQAAPDGSREAHMKPAQNGSGLSNSNAIGIEIIAKDDNDVTEAQTKAFAKFASTMKQKYPGIGDNVFGHGEVNSHKRKTEGSKVVTAFRDSLKREGDKIASMASDVAAHTVKTSKYVSSMATTAAASMKGDRPKASARNFDDRKQKDDKVASNFDSGRFGPSPKVASNFDTGRFGAKPTTTIADGKIIGKGIMEAQRDVVQAPQLSATQTSPTAFQEPPRGPRNSAVAGSPTGTQSQANANVPSPKDIPHTDELTMLMANSSMMA